MAANSGCGGETDNSRATGASGSAGTGGSTSGSGGSTSGSGGSAGDLGDCAPPSDPTRAALCLTLLPEAIQFESDALLDGRGVLVVQVFDTPTPDGPDGAPGLSPIAQQVYPPLTDAGFPVPVPREQTLVTELPAFRLDDLPPTAYVRAIFADSVYTLARRRPTWGMWLGGYDLSGGWIENPPIQAVEIQAGTGRSLRMPLVALRRLRATLTLASGVAPLDDGEGPAWALAVRTATPREDEPIHGGATAPCAAVGGGSSATMEGVLVGSGTFYLAAGVDDYSLGGTAPRGALVSYDVNGATFSLPAATRVDVAPNAYTVDATVPLSFLVPLGNGAAPRPFSCTAVDAGTSG